MWAARTAAAQCVHASARPPSSARPAAAALQSTARSLSSLADTNARLSQPHCTHRRSGYHSKCTTARQHEVSTSSWSSSPHRSSASPPARGLFSLSGDDAKSADDFYRSIKQLHETVLRPVNGRLMGPLGRDIDEMIPLPVVLLVGNHSSGKSTFINWATGRQVQTTGVAPTDDSFTLIAPGRTDMDQDGPSAVGDPLLGLGGLRHYGSHLVNHLSLKIRANLLLDNPPIMLIDTPGMIDAPASVGAGGGSDVAMRSKDRGYDFAGVVSWFAQRADVILLFQDPAKPGTTGETLNIMTTALAGHEYKTLIVLNKADQFTTVHDFARAYGALCWNLSKVIPRKDLPKIYTMSVPVTSAGVQGDGKPTPLSSANSVGTATSPAAVTRGDGPAISAMSALPEAQADLAAARQEILWEVKRAPLRRVDNLVTRLYDSARLLRMYAAVLAAVKREYSWEVARHVGTVATGVTALASAAGGLAYMGSPEVAAFLGAVGALVGTGGGWWANKQLARRASYFIDGPGMDEAFRRAHYLQLADRDEFVAQLYERVRPQLQTTLRTLGILGAPAVKRSDLAALDGIVAEDVPALRRQATKAGMLHGNVDSSEGGGPGKGVFGMLSNALGLKPAAAAAAAGQAAGEAAASSKGTGGTAAPAPAPSPAAVAEALGLGSKAGVEGKAGSKSS